MEFFCTSISQERWKIQLIWLQAVRTYSEGGGRKKRQYRKSDYQHTSTYNRMKVSLYLLGKLSSDLV